MSNNQRKIQGSQHRSRMQKEYKPPPPKPQKPPAQPKEPKRPQSKFILTLIIEAVMRSMIKKDLDQS